MATKTIGIELEAYRRLKSVQRADESLSQTIRPLIRPPFDLAAWLAKLDRLTLSGSAAVAIERQIARRRHVCPSARSRS